MNVILVGHGRMGKMLEELLASREDQNFFLADFETVTASHSRYFVYSLYYQDGFCDEAWKAIYQYVFALAHGTGEGLFYYGDWIRKPGVAICSCNDGLRPVIFKLEATDEESVIDYEPITR